jgi:hypothetical protein
VGLADLNWAPTFAFLDQQSTEVKWPMIEVPARYERRETWERSAPRSRDADG